jgi:hypothetical protein
MAGMPKRRAKREAAAREALREQAKELAEQTKESSMDKHSKYTQERADEIVMLVADGHPIDDTKVGKDVVLHGAARKVGVSGRTIYRWQLDHPDFAERVKQAREESGHRHADQVQALSQLALDQPHMAQAVKVASDNLKWMAMVRNRQYYSESKRIDIEHTSDLGERLMRAQQRGRDMAEQNLKSGTVGIHDIMELINAGRAVVTVDGVRIIPHELTGQKLIGSQTVVDAEIVEGVTIQ